ncbi:multivesicular body subunit 12Bb isoform X6 [Syngnathoides biaculeatus]|uniref:multivesicular body subunit 12Bb isoform X6 n=1 Tax=Syngnathoides biaculeatus TaxID=300417 RepID=UPI002ADE6B83|nr:multivesicular body subunit 12Bb isoform X6 [Syngnathoides biaculeatus]
MSVVSEQIPTEPISAVGVLSSPSKAPDDYFVVAQTTDGSDADLWKDGLFKSKVTRYLCFSRKPGPDVVEDVKLTDIKDALPEGFVAVQETLDTNEAAMRKRRLCVKISPRAVAHTAVFDIRVLGKSKFHLLNYTCMGRTSSRPECERQSSSGGSTVAVGQGQGITQQRNAMDDVPFGIAQRFYDTPKEMQQVNLMGITIKSLAEIEEEVSRGRNARLQLPPLARNAKQTVSGL